MRRLSIAFLAVLLAGCGAGTKRAGPAGGAEVAPKSSAFLLRVNTDFGSADWAAVNMLLKSFPDGEKLFAGIAGGADFDRDVKPALGPETDLVALSGRDLRQGVFLGLTQPKSPAKLDALLAKGTPRAVSEQVGDWRVISETRPAIDRFKQARNGGVLTSDKDYRKATDGLPENALARVYVDGAAVAQALGTRLKTGSGPVPGLGRIGWLAGAVTAREKGFALEARIQGDEIEATPFTAELPAEVPAGVTAYVDFKGLDATLEELRRTPALSNLLGSSSRLLGGVLDDVIALFEGEGAFYVRPGTHGDEYTLVLKVADEQEAEATLDRLATLAGAVLQKVPEQVEIEGVSAEKLDLGKVTLYYAVFDGKLVITSAESGIRGLAGAGPRLAGSKAWQDAKAAAGMPSETAGILYADVGKLAPLLRKETKGTPTVERNLAALGTGLVYASVDGSLFSLEGFLSVR